MTNEEIAQRIAKSSTAYANVTLEQWQYIDDLFQGIDGQILCAIQDGLFEQYRDEMVNALLKIAGGASGMVPKEINCDIYAGLLRGIQIASIRDIAKHAKQAIEQERKKQEAKAGNHSKLPANPYV